MSSPQYETHARINSVSSLPAYPYLYFNSANGSAESLPLPSYPRPSYPYTSSNETVTTLPSYHDHDNDQKLLLDDENSDDLPILEGWPLGLTVFSLCLSLLVATLDATIISTSLITIASDLGHFDKAGWVVVAYLLTYSGFLIIFTRLSDIFGRKPVLLFAVLMFLVWSLACGCARTIEQLSIFRALQGIGGAGIYSLAYASMLDVVPFRLVGAASGAISMSTAVAGLLGPVVGGAITSHTTWRWIFWINVPCGVIVTICVILLFPGSMLPKSGKAVFKRVDWPGIILSLAGSILLVVALSVGGGQYPWKSIFIIAMLVVSGLCFIGFGVWESILTSREEKWKILPLLPTRLVSNRVMAATLFTVFFTGVPFVVIVIALPQRLQIVNANSPEAAGLHMLPLIVSTAFAAIVTGGVTGKVPIAWHILVASNILMSVGCGLLSILPVDQSISKIGYFYQTILGLGFGMTMASSMVVARTAILLKDNAVSLGAITQLRQFGGVVGFAATQAILDQKFRAELVGKLTSTQLDAVMLSTSNIARLEPAQQSITRAAYGVSADLQLRVVMAFAIAAFVASLFAYQRKPLNLQVREDERVARHEGKSPQPEARPKKDSKARNLPDYEEFVSYRYSNGSCYKEPVTDLLHQDERPQRSSGGGNACSSGDSPVPATGPEHSARTNTRDPTTPTTNSNISASNSSNTTAEPGANAAMPRPPSAHLSLFRWNSNDWSLQTQIPSSSLFHPVEMSIWGYKAQTESESWGWL